MLSPIFYGYGRSIAKAFRTLGCEVACFEYAAPSKGIRAMFRYSIPRKLGFDVEVEIKEDFGKRISNEIRSFKPDGIVVVRGDFYSETIATSVKLMSNRPKVVIWLMDGVKNVPGVLEQRDKYDQWFVFEPTDILMLRREYGIKSEFLPLAFDPDYYYPLESIVPHTGFQADISFVGTVMDADRRQLLERLAGWSLKQEKSFKIVSGSYRIRNYPYLYPHRSLWKCLWKFHLEHSEVNVLYNNCVANLNIHVSQSVEGLNMRFFEILGSGGLQIVEKKKAQIELGFVPDRDFLTYSGIEELEEKIKFSIEHYDEVKKIANSGHEKVKNHDFVARANFLLKNAFC